MGSLAAVVRRHPDAGDRARAEAMLVAAPHRGALFETATLGGATFGVSTDVRGEGASVAVESGSLAAVVGRLDNRADLVERLWDDPPAARPCDAAIVARALARWGEAAPNRLRGALAATVSDGDRLWCFRDHVGLTPLVWRRHAGAAFLATEVKQVLAGAGMRREADVAALERHFFGGFAERDTVVRGVERVPRATVVRWSSAGGVSQHRYWRPAELVETARITVGEAREQLAALLEQAIDRSLTGADALMLSGGVDSTAIAAFGEALHRRRFGAPLRCVSKLYPDHPSVDERAYIEAVSAHLGLDVHPITPVARPLDDVGTWADLLDGPMFAAHVPEIAEAFGEARRTGATNVVTGELAEYVYGSTRHLLGHLVATGRLRAAAAHVRGLRALGAPRSRIVRTLLPTVTPRPLSVLYGRLRPRPAEVPPWYRPVDRPLTSPRYDLSLPARARWPAGQAGPLHGSPADFEAAEQSAAHLGVTVRRPFADVDLWEFFLSLPAEVKFPHPTAVKALMRETMRGRLPDAVVDRRKKTVFDEWLLADPGYPALRKWLIDTPFRLRGIDYPVLEERIDRERMGLMELMFAYELASVHAFAVA